MPQVKRPKVGHAADDVASGASLNIASTKASSNSNDDSGNDGKPRVVGSSALVQGQLEEEEGGVRRRFEFSTVSMVKTRVGLPAVTVRTDA